MATQHPVPRSEPGSMGAAYVSLLAVIAVVGVALSAFDSIARNVSLPLILHDLRLSVATGGLIFGASFFVTFLANLALGPIMDRWGRKTGFLLSLMAAALFSGLTAFVQQGWQYAVVGSLAGTCLTVLPSAQVAISEECPARHRGLIMGLLSASFPLGAITVGLVGSLVLPGGHWRWLFLMAFAPVIVAIAAAVVLRDPERSREVREVKAATDPSSVRLRHAVDVEKARRSEWSQVFAPDLRRQTTTLLVSGFLVNISTGMVLALGVTYIVAYDHLEIGAASLAITVESVGSLIGGIVLGRLGDFLPSRNLLIAFSLVGAAAIMLLAIPGNVAFVFAVLAAFGLCGQGALACWFRYVTESFPTRARGTGMMLTEGVFFLGLAFAPSMFGALMGAGQFALTAILAGVLAAVGALVLFAGRLIAPRRELEDIAI